MSSAMEGADFLDPRGTDHSQNIFVRGVCRRGIMPCNGMRYAPPDRRNATRQGSTAATVSAPLQDDGRVKLGGTLTPPVAAGSRVFVASRDTRERCTCST